jgi:uncharacterized repeat protein (TIGR01451 family)
MTTQSIRIITSTFVCAALLAGCAQQQQHGTYVPSGKAPAAPAPPPKPSATSAYFPSGRPEGSGLMIEKTAPAQVLAGQPFEYSYKVSNLTDATLENVNVMDRVTSNFATTDSDPKAASVSGGNATWNLGSLGPKDSRMITVKGSSADEGVVTTCGWATYNPVVCQDIHVVKANIALTKTEPSDVSICDPIPTTLTVKNSGTSQLTGVRITDDLPSGLTADGKSSLSFDVGNLGPGESKDVRYNAVASTTGQLVNTAKVTSAEGVSAQATATTTVHKPVLTIACDSTKQQYMGRKMSLKYTVSNTGDSPAAGVKLEVPVPPGLDPSPDSNGQVSNGRIVWDLGTIDAGGKQTVGATLMSSAAGSFDFVGTAKGTCADAVSTTCSTRVVGIAAILLEKADDPDPVAVGDSTTYTVKVTNQGSADDHNVQVIVTIAPELTPVSSSDGSIAGQVVTLPVVPSLAPKQAVTYKIVAKGVKAGDGHTRFKLSSDMLTSPISAEESTTVY